MTNSTNQQLVSANNSNQLIQIGNISTTAGLTYTNQVTEGLGQTVTGTFSIPDIGDRTSLEIAGKMIIANGWGKTPVTIDTAYGQLVIKSFEYNGTIHYEYTGNGQAKDHTGKQILGELSDVFTVKLSRRSTVLETAELKIAIEDTNPEAVAQTAAIDVGMTEVSGDVLAGATINADGLGGVSFAQNTAGEIMGQYGKLVFNTATGKWDYHLDNDNATVKSLGYQKTLEETFNYAINDTDGDAAQSSLTITITGVDNEATSAPTVEILTGCDDALGNQEITAGVQAVIGLPSEALVGDTLAVDTNNDGQADLTRVLTQSDLNEGKVTVIVPAQHVPTVGNVIVSATVTDMAGNVSQPGSDTAPLLVDMPPIFLNHLGAFLTSEYGPTNECGINYCENGYKTTEMNDSIYIGYTDTALTWSCGDGDFERDCWSDPAWVMDTGAGEDKIFVRDDIKDDVTVNTGTGSDYLRVGSDVMGTATINMGSCDDKLEVSYNLHGKSTVNMGTGNDVLIVGEDIDDCATVNMGSGQDNIYVGEDIENYATVNTGAGNDVLTVARYIEDCSTVNMGSGNDSLTTYGIVNRATVDMGKGNDSVVIEKTSGCGSTVLLGQGDDTLEFQGKAFNGDIQGGSGKDTLVLNYTADSSLVNAWCHDTNLSSADFTGIETIQMKGMNVVDIRFSDLLNDTTNESPLFIQGNYNSKVDLGANNWNSDSSWKANLKDGGNWWSAESWQNTGSQTVDNITYDVYHNTAAGSDTSNDVFIQQGVTVI